MRVKNFQIDLISSFFCFFTFDPRWSGLIPNMHLKCNQYKIQFDIQNTSNGRIHGDEFSNWLDKFFFLFFQLSIHACLGWFRICTWNVINTKYNLTYKIHQIVGFIEMNFRIDLIGSFFLFCQLSIHAGLGWSRICTWKCNHYKIQFDIQNASNGRIHRDEFSNWLDKFFFLFFQLSIHAGLGWSRKCTWNVIISNYNVTYKIHQMVGFIGMNFRIDLIGSFFCFVNFRTTLVWVDPEYAPEM